MLLYHVMSRDRSWYLTDMRSFTVENLEKSLVVCYYNNYIKEEESYKLINSNKYNSSRFKEK